MKCLCSLKLNIQGKYKSQKEGSGSGRKENTSPMCRGAKNRYHTTPNFAGRQNSHICPVML